MKSLTANARGSPFNRTGQAGNVYAGNRTQRRNCTLRVPMLSPGMTSLASKTLKSRDPVTRKSLEPKGPSSPSCSIGS
jgi:hypothetical protein